MADLFDKTIAENVTGTSLQSLKSPLVYRLRYLMLTPEDGWKDLGWQIDEYAEFEHRYQ
ncbi:MAG: hypothetical protein ACI9G1_002060 [Pirellulaceae bacterium]|jgi:hypothetical protein